MSSESTLLITFKKKIEEAVTLVPSMVPEEKLKAVQFWNVVSEKLQEIVNNSAADISALAYEMEKKTGTMPNGDSQTVIETPKDPHDLLIQEDQPEMASYKLDIADPSVPSVPKSSLTPLPETGHQDPIASFPSSEVTLEHTNEQVLPPQSSTEHPMLAELLDGPITLREPLSPEEPVPDIEKNVFSKNATVPRIINKKTRISNTGKWDENDGSWKVMIGKTQISLGPSVRRQPPRSKRRKKNFALARSDSEESDGEMDNTTIKADQDGIEVVEKSDGENENVENVLEENGTSGIILMNAKSLKGTSEDECFEEESGMLDDEVKDELPDDEQSQTKPYSCTECRARFSTKGNLVVHVRRHTGEKPFNCSQCKAKFSTKGNLKRHIKTHSGERPWECDQCGGRFTEKKSLKVHMRRHTGEKPYACTVCGKQFAQTGILQTHMAMHLDQKEHLCEHCGKSFRQKSQLRLHMMRHEGVRKYQCPSCASKFLTKGDLERHNRTHTGERPFICDICGKTFTRQQSLNEHMNRHYGLKPYECKYCSKGFAEMSACYKHIKHHERYEAEQLSNDSEDRQRTSLTAVSCDSRKYTVLVQTGETLDVATCNEISLVEGDQTSAITEEEVTENIGDFTAINLLATASSFQQNY